MLSSPSDSSALNRRNCYSFDHFAERTLCKLGAVRAAPVSPLHAAFEQMYAQHLVTFAEVRRMLQSHDVSTKEIADYLAGKEILERGHVALIERAQHGTPLMRSEQLRDIYESYVYGLARCIVSPSVEAEHGSVAYYTALRDVLRSVHQAALLQGTEATRCRLEALRNLETIVGRLHAYHANVQVEYQELRSRCAI